MQNDQQPRNEAGFYQAIDKAAMIYKRHGNLAGAVIRRNQATGETRLALGDDGESSDLYETTVLSTKGVDGKWRSSLHST